MNIHNNAHLTPRGRATMVAYVCEYGWSRRATARAFHATTKTVRRWVQRYEREGAAGPQDRSSRLVLKRHGRSERYRNTRMAH